MAWYWRRESDVSAAASIELDAANIEECEAAASQLYTMILSQHGPGVANKIFSQHLFDKREIARHKNFRLLSTALQRLSGGTPLRQKFEANFVEQLEINFADTQSRSVEQVAAELAKENDSLPNELRYGPSGTTNPSVMAKQIRRLIKGFLPQ
jgi:hypothetical protein